MAISPLIQPSPYLPYIAFIETAKRQGLALHDIRALVTYVHKELPSWKQASIRAYVKKHTIPGLVHTIEFDPATHNVYVHFKSKKRLGKGITAKVTLTLLLQTGQCLAQKTYSKRSLSAFSIDEGEQKNHEATLHLALLDCPNIVKIHRVMERELLFEHMSLGSLYDFLGKYPAISKEVKMVIAQGAISGMQQLHRAGYLHRDIKSENLLLHKNSQLVVKLGDLGSACTIGHTSQPVVDPAVGRSPAMWQSFVKNQPHQFRTEDDLWAMGVLLFELEYGKDYAPCFAEQVEALHNACLNREQNNASDIIEAAYDAYMAAVTAFYTDFIAKPNTLNSQIKAFLSPEPENRLILL